MHRLREIIDFAFLIFVIHTVVTRRQSFFIVSVIVDVKRYHFEVIKAIQPNTWTFTLKLKLLKTC